MSDKFAGKSVVITGRSVDWPYGFNSHFHVFPRGEKIDGAGGDNSLSFETIYGTVLLSGSTDIGGPVDAVFEGMNEEGLVSNLLYLAENDFGQYYRFRPPTSLLCSLDPLPAEPVLKCE